MTCHVQLKLLIWQKKLQSVSIIVNTLKIISIFKFLHLLSKYLSGIMKYLNKN